MPGSLDPSAPAHRFLEQYAKQYHSGAFATPTAKELAAAPGLIHRDELRVHPSGNERSLVIAKRLTRDSVRTDFTGSRIVLPGGSLVATHIAHTPGFLPDLSPYDFVMIYPEDHELRAAVTALGLHRTGVRVTAAAEVIACYGLYPRNYLTVDVATVVDMPFYIGDRERAAITAELAQVSGWDDDFPYYSDGSWSAVCLKGFWPDDPGRGVKPSEMPRSWKAAHPEDLARTCDWTVLAERLPNLMHLVQSISWIWRTERVRLLRMAPGGRLGRHTDITDRYGGTRDGQITRFHIPLTTHPETKLISWDLDGERNEHHLEPWHCYYLDARKPHAVVNGPVDRVHLVIDVVTDITVRQSIKHAYLEELFR